MVPTILIRPWFSHSLPSLLTCWRRIFRIHRYRAAPGRTSCCDNLHQEPTKSWFCRRARRKDARIHPVKSRQNKTRLNGISGSKLFMLKFGVHLKCKTKETTTYTIQCNHATKYDKTYFKRRVMGTVRDSCSYVSLHVYNTWLKSTSFQ